MLKLKIGLVLIFILSVYRADAKIDFNEKCKKAFDDIFHLKLPKADELLNEELKDNPENVFAIYLKGLSEIVNVFINEEYTDFKKLKISIPDKIKKIDKYAGKSPYKQFFKGQLLFYYGITQTKFDELFSAGSNIRDAYILLKNNAVKYPDFLPNQMVMGVIETFSGTAPNSFKWIISMFGVKASVLGGMKRLEKIANTQTTKDSELEFFKLESKIFQGGLYHLVLHKEKEGWTIIDACTQDYKINLFSNYLRSSFLIKKGKSEMAIQVLANRPAGKEYVPFEFLNYLLGVGKLSRLDKDADKYLLKFIKNFKGRNYLKSAMQKLAWYYLINDDYANYRLYISKISKIGYEFTDEDKQAAKCAVNNSIPNISLLQARLLFDGGYFDRAFKELEGRTIKNYTETHDKAEYIYRMARIYQKQEKYKVAISYFKITMSYCKNFTFYYATASSIELATIYETLGDKPNAKIYYKKALTFTKNKEYVNSLEQRAKAGLERVSQ